MKLDNLSRRVETIAYQDEFKGAYVSLNRQWIEKYFEIEPMDTQQLENPTENILKKGGEIFIVLENGKAVGTCALLPHGKDCFELAKMAVDPDYQGRGYGDLLMTKAISWAKARKANSIVLLSNTILSAAISLYQKFGFRTVKLGSHPDYDRCNIEMKLELSQV